jgi:hypothetical protein
MAMTKEDIDHLSPHLFWDVNQEECSWEQHSHFIVERVLEYGLWNDWNILYRGIGLSEIANIALHLRSLSPKSLNFISTLAQIPKEKFRCFTTTQSNPPHWNF